MKVTAMIAEYNPFHNGHLYHATKARECTGAEAVICVLSGPFVQRGDIAIADKWARAKCALACGCDLVVELPFCFCAQSSEYFACGSILLIAAMKVASSVFFGSEDGDISSLEHAAAILLQERKDGGSAIRQHMDEGMSYPAARQRALGLEVLKGANNILGTEYIKAIKQYAPHLEPITIKREGNAYNSTKTTGGFISATAARQLIFSHGMQAVAEHIPPAVLDVLMQECTLGKAPVSLKPLDNYLLGLIRQRGPEYVQKLAYVSEGLENRICKAASLCSDLPSMIAQVKTRRYTYTRLARIFISAAMGFTAQDLALFATRGPAYLRVLGANATGRKLLRSITSVADLPVITKTAAFLPKDDYTSKMLALDFLAQDMYALCYPSASQRGGKKDLTTSPIMV